MSESSRRDFLKKNVISSVAIAFGIPLVYDNSNSEKVKGERLMIADAVLPSLNAFKLEDAVKFWI